jgi:RimJ/RimL family protein N-acetyltransferase
VRSLNALERLGFTHEGVLRHWHVHRGEPRDVVILGLLREEWERSPLAAVGVRVLD